MDLRKAVRRVTAPENSWSELVGRIEPLLRLKLERFILNNGGWSHACVESGGVDDSLKGRPWLALSIESTVEFAVYETASPNERQDLPRLSVH